MIIYVIINKITKMLYVGQTTLKLKERWYQHKSSGVGCIFFAIKKYSAENFEIFEIARAASQQELDELEIFYISLLDTTNPSVGYNILPGGRGGGRFNFKGKTQPASHRKKMSEGMKKRWQTSPPSRVCSESMKEKMSERRRLWWSQQTTEKKSLMTKKRLETRTEKMSIHN